MSLLQDIAKRDKELIHSTSKTEKVCRLQCSNVDDVRKIHANIKYVRDLWPWLCPEIWVRDIITTAGTTDLLRQLGFVPVAREEKEFDETVRYIVFKSANHQVFVK